jgi:hypothetical protein
MPAGKVSTQIDRDLAVNARVLPPSTEPASCHRPRARLGARACLDLPTTPYDRPSRIANSHIPWTSTRPRASLNAMRARGRSDTLRRVARLRR